MAWVAVVGPGAVGTVVAVALARAGVETLLVSRSGGCRRVEAVARGLGSAETLLCGWDAAGGLPRPGIVVYAVKAPQLPGALQRARGLGWTRAPAVSLQNGLYSLERLEEAHASAAAGIVFFGAVKLAAASAVLRARGPVLLGCRRGCGAWLGELAGALRRGGLEARLVEDIEPWRWLKLAVNAAVNPVTVLAWAPNRVVAEDPVARGLAVELAREAGRVAALSGVELPRDPVAEALRVAEATGDNCSSMLQDVAAGRETEIDYINGAVAAEARRLGSRAPFNEAVAAAVKLAAPRLAGRRLPC